MAPFTFLKADWISGKCLILVRFKECKGRTMALFAFPKADRKCSIFLTIPSDLRIRKLRASSAAGPLLGSKRPAAVFITVLAGCDDGSAVQDDSYR